MPRGGYLARRQLADRRRTSPAPPVRKGERAAEVVGLGAPDLVVPGARVDVLVTRDGEDGAAAATELALEDVEVLAAAGAGPARATTAASASPRRCGSRVRDAVYLAAAQSFAREVRLLPRAAGDRERGGPGQRRARVALTRRPLGLPSEASPFAVSRPRAPDRAGADGRRGRRRRRSPPRSREAGGLGFLAAGYKPVDGVRADVDAVRALTGAAVRRQPVRPAAARPRPGGGGALRARAGRRHEHVGAPRHDDDGWEEKLALVAELRVPVVSFAFGCPDAAEVARLHAAGVAVWATVTTPAEARAAEAAGADALVVQGVEAGGHRATFDDTAPVDLGLLAALQLIRPVTSLPLIATGGIATGRAVAAVLVAGAAAAQLGTAFMLAPEAATVPGARRGGRRATARPA